MVIDVAVKISPGIKPGVINLNSITLFCPPGTLTAMNPIFTFSILASDEFTLALNPFSYGTLKKIS